LFLAWALIIFPLVLISQFSPLWAIWLLLVNITLILFWQQGLTIQTADKYYLYILLLMVNGLGLYIREWVYNRKVDWLQGRWHRILLAFIILVISFIPISLYIMNNEFTGGS
ncbi:MAG TPA: hypothetical protein PLD88_15235, partial [Candidatus Berkiella sp.]|nr:hypothetical protein [Candidatus Berkiella sp.]